MKISKNAQVIIRKDKAYLSAFSKTDFIQMATEPFIIAEWQSLSVVEKFELIQQALAGSKSGLKFPDSAAQYTKYILDQFGMKSWGQLVKGSKAVSVNLDKDGAEYTFTPNKTVRGGFEGIKSGIEVLASGVTMDEFMKVFEIVLLRCV